MCAFLIVFSQVLWKLAIDKNGGLFNSEQSLLANISNVLFAPAMLLGICLYIVASVFWMYLLGKYDYSYIYPMMSISYVLSFFFAVYFFNETLNLYKILGVILIISGVFVIAKGANA
ncbi:MAG: EamA family transporter [Gammaproteobacteria bacterium]|nr:EamA family transporter [Gammaproteobacteria bacterium]MDH5692752.1 EamA family transporter [Gammaproteobacteria bacterium]